MMRNKVIQLESEAQVINWYLRVLEKGKDTRRILREYNTEIRELETKLKDNTHKLEEYEQNLK